VFDVFYVVFVLGMFGIGEFGVGYLNVVFGVGGVFGA